MIWKHTINKSLKPIQFDYVNSSTVSELKQDISCREEMGAMRYQEPIWFSPQVILKSY